MKILPEKSQTELLKEIDEVSLGLLLDIEKNPHRIHLCDPNKISIGNKVIIRVGTQPHENES